MIEKYLTFMGDMGRSRNTLKTYKSALAHFKHYIEKARKDLNNITIPDILEFKNYLAYNGNKNNTIRNRLLIVKGFLDYSKLNKGYSNRAFSFVLPAEEKRNVNNLHPSEVNIILSCLEEKEEHIRFCFYLMLFAGLRVSEVATLERENINIKDDILVFNILREKSKSKKARLVPYTDLKTLPFLINYINENAVVSKVSKRTLQYHANQISEKTGIKFASHSLRHTFATEMLSANTRIDIIQEVLGHSSIETTRRYARTLEKDVLKIGAKIKKEGVLK